MRPRRTIENASAAAAPTRRPHACRPGLARGALLALFASACLTTPPDARAADGEDARLRQLEDQVRALRDELGELKREGAVSTARSADVEQQVSDLTDALERVRIGGYGSVRYEANDLADDQNGFTFRRLVFTTDAQVAPRLRFYSEIEYERFRELELEQTAGSIDGGLGIEQAIEGTNGSEISLEQAWLQWDFDTRLALRTGAVLVPLGRFNIDHDDNQWNLPRRSLVDRGVPVLPVTAAWDELGAGLLGRVPIGHEGSLAYQLYVVNGTSLGGELESKVLSRPGDTHQLELEAEFQPKTGGFAGDVKEGKAVTGRVAWSPRTGHEIAASFYTGRYTPNDFSGHNVTSLALDGITRGWGFELEGELVTTGWDGIRDVAESFARHAVSKEAALENDELEAEVEFELAGLARRKTGYWLELRRPFWPGFLPRGAFEDPQLVPTLRFEQVWLHDRLVEADVSGGALTAFETDDSRLGRVTFGLAYRPTPLVVLTAAYEYTWSDSGDLVGLTNFLAAQPGEDSVNAFLMGASFGF